MLSEKLIGSEREPKCENPREQPGLLLPDEVFSADLLKASFQKVAQGV